MIKKEDKPQKRNTLKLPDDDDVKSKSSKISRASKQSTRRGRRFTKVVDVIGYLFDQRRKDLANNKEDLTI